MSIMFSKKHSFVVTSAILVNLVGIYQPSSAFFLAQSDNAPTTFSLPDKLPQDAEVQIAASNSTTSINESLTESFSAKYPKAQVNIETQDSNSALKSLSEGKADLVSIGRTLTPEEKAEGFVEVPISREKIAIVISKNNSYDGTLTIAQFAQIFRGEITDWSEIDGAPGKIKLVDMPDSNDTRQAFPNYPVFQSAEFIAGSDTVQLEEDSTDAMIAQLGASGIGYAVANDVIDRDDVQIVTMHQTLPDNPKYPFSQPFSLVYQGTPSEAAKAYLGFATADGEVTPPNTVEGETSGAQTIAKKGKWWDWLPLILGIPLIVLGAIFALGGRKKSDQESAISNIPNPDAPNGGIGLAGGADGGGMSAIGANISSNAGNAVGTTSKLGNAAIANGDIAATTQVVRGKQRAKNDIDLDLDEPEIVNDIDLDLNEPEIVTEISSNPVSKFPGQEKKVQPNNSTGIVRNIQWNSKHLLKKRPYEIENILGEGGFGITYKAKHLDLEFPVVIKTPNAKLQRDRNYPKYVRRFKKEAKILAKLCVNPHPHIVRVIDYFEEEDLPCMVMDFIPGESLYDLVWQKGKIPEAKAVEYISQIGSALISCHQAGIVHRDVHPRNIIVRSDNNKAILIDFGIAGSIATTVSNHAGNQAFAPWEQLINFESNSNAADSKTKKPEIDIYSLAASFYYLLTSEPPTPCLARKFGNSSLTSPNQFNSNLSDEVNWAVLKGMELEAEARPQSIREWLDLFVSSSQSRSI